MMSLVQPDLDYGWILLLLTAFARPSQADQPSATAVDPLAAVLQPELKSTVEVVLEDYRHERIYNDNDFPMTRAAFRAFRQDIVQGLTETLGLEPATQHYYRLIYGTDYEHVHRGSTRTFRTHASAETVCRHSFVVVTGMNHHASPRYAASDLAAGKPRLP